MIRLIILTGVVLLLCGCISHKDTTPPAAPFTASASQFSGRILGPASTQPVLSSHTASAVSVELLYLSQVPADQLQPIGANSRLMTAIGADSALLAVPESLAQVRVGSGAEVGRLYEQIQSGALGPPAVFGTYSGILGPDVSFRIRLQPQNKGQSELELILNRPSTPAHTLQIGILNRIVPGLEGGPAEERAPRVETVIASLDVASTQAEAGLIIPVKPEAIVALIRLGQPGEGISESTMARVRADLASAQARPAALSAEQLLIQGSLAALRNPEARRAVIVQLASQGQAPIARDLALSADDATLELFAGRLGKALPASAPGQLGWTLDRTAFNFLAHLRVEGKLPGDLDTVLLVHAGEAGNSAISMGQFADRIATRADLENRLIAENYIYLEEVSPAARVRAYDWLKARDKAPVNYDPLASATERRKALDAALEAMAPSIQPGGKQQ